MPTPARTLANALAATGTLAVAVAISLPMLGLTRSNTASHAALLQARTVALGIEAMAFDAGVYAPAFRTAPDGSITHHSAVLVAGGYAAAADFTSPLAPDGGAPAAGAHVAQVERTAFTVNGAIMPPEPLAYSGTNRHYRLVRHAAASPQSGARLVRRGDAIDPARTLLVTEWLVSDGYAALAQGPTIMSHRPIVPFVGVTAGRSPEREPTSGAGTGAGDAPFAYPEMDDVFTDNARFGEALTSRGATEINAMGRSHVSGKGGGSAAVIMLDGSARLATPRQSVEQRLWGEAFHAITGDRGVR